MKHRFAFSWGEVRARSEVDLRLNLGLVANCMGVGQTLHPSAQFPDLQNGIKSTHRWTCRKKWTQCLLGFLTLLCLVSSFSLAYLPFWPSLLPMASLFFASPLFSSLPLLPPSQKKVAFFSTLFFRGFYFAVWCHSFSPPANRTILIKTKLPQEPRKGHLGMPCIQQAPQRDSPSWRTFELKRIFLFTRTSFHLNKGEIKRLTPELKEHHTLHILLHCNPRTVNYSWKKALWPLQEKYPATD